jgi:myo-inositol-1(or 4)-monophosphatase
VNEASTTSADPAAHHLELVAVEVALLATSVVRAAAGQAAATGTKSSPTDVVTETDLRSETLIRRELLGRCPGSTIVGEEYGKATGENNVGWIVDPIDGTVNFLYDLPVVAVSIAGTIDGEVVAGAVADVHRRDVYSATMGCGAQRNGTAITASEPEDLSQALVGTGFAYEASLRADQGRFLTQLLPACRDIRCMGSAALNLCWVASGQLDAYFERDLKVYDYAAGALIAAEAGAMVEQPAPGGLDLTMAASPSVYSPLQTLLIQSVDG